MRQGKRERRDTKAAGERDARRESQSRTKDNPPPQRRGAPTALKQSTHKR